MKLIVGLGNPGSRYSDTRHNAGRLLIEFIAHQKCVSFKSQKKLQASFAQIQIDSTEVLLAYPETFMNISGEAVQLLVQHFEIDATKNLLVVMDEAALPFGQYRLRSKGSAGGHNGLKSIETALGTSHYSRLRLGIGSAETALQPLENFVLSRFSKEEKAAWPEVLERGSQACSLWVQQPIAKAMNVVNACIN